MEGARLLEGQMPRVLCPGAPPRRFTRAGSLTFEFKPDAGVKYGKITSLPTISAGDAG
jgi:hypothetical protein